MITVVYHQVVICYYLYAITVPVTDFVHFFLESVTLKEDEKRRLIHVG